MSRMCLAEPPLYAVIDMRNEDWSALPSRKLEDSYPSLDLIKAIVAKGANVNAKLTKNLPGRSGMDAGDTALDEGTTPFMRAARSGDSATMRVLLAAGADPKLATKEGTTALEFAAGVGYRDKQTKGTEAEALEALPSASIREWTLIRRTPKAKRRCMARHRGERTALSNIWSSTVRSWMRKRAADLRRSTSPWARINLAFPFRMTVRWR